MFQKFLYAYIDSIAVRIAITGLFMIVPVGITTSWLGASYLMEFSGASFQKIFLGSLIVWPGQRIYKRLPLIVLLRTLDHPRSSNQVVGVGRSPHCALRTGQRPGRLRYPSGYSLGRRRISKIN